MSLKVTVADEWVAGSARDAADPEGSYEGRVLGDRYVLGRRIGRGGMGEVYEATDRETGRCVAVKCLRQSRQEDEHVSRRMLREARAVAAIGHRNIVELLDVGKDDRGKWFVVFELLQGRDLDQALEAGGLTLGDVWRVGVETLDALDAAHRAGIVHRDLKPANLYLHELPGGEGWVVKLLDFGIAKQQNLANDETKLTTTGIVVGTPQYMSPEQARGKTLDGRSDIWSVGCVLFRMLTGSVPFDEDNFADLMARVLTEEPPRLEELYPELPPCLWKAVDGALHRRPDNRWETAGAMRDALLDGLTLEAMRRGEAPDWASRQLPPPLGRERARATDRLPSSRPPPSVLTPGPPPRRGLRLATGVLLSLLSALGGYGAVVALRDEPAPPAPVADAPATEEQAEPPRAGETGPREDQGANEREDERTPEEQPPSTPSRAPEVTTSAEPDEGIETEPRPPRRRAGPVTKRAEMSRDESVVERRRPADPVEPMRPQTAAGDSPMAAATMRFEVVRDYE